MSEQTPATRLASYVYAVARPGDGEQFADMRGVDGAEVHLVSYRDLVAVVSSVPLEEFDETALKAKLERLEWLEAVARAHHAVVDAVAAHGTVLPFRLATVYYGDGRVTQMLRDGYAWFSSTLDELTGRVELGVKVYVDQAAAAEAPSAEPAAGPAESPGRNYLRRRREQRRSRDAAWEQAAELGGRVDTELRDLAADSRRHRPQNPQLSGVQLENVLNAAYLVDVAQVAAFAEKAREMDGLVSGTRVELTGPWAPYSFALPGEAIPADTADNARGGEA